MVQEALGVRNSALITIRELDYSRNYGNLKIKKKISSKELMVKILFFQNS